MYWVILQCINCEQEMQGEIKARLTSLGTWFTDWGAPKLRCLNLGSSRIDTVQRQAFSAVFNQTLRFLFYADRCHHLAPISMNLKLQERIAVIKVLPVDALTFADEPPIPSFFRCGVEQPGELGERNCDRSPVTQIYAHTVLGYRYVPGLQYSWHSAYCRIVTCQLAWQRRSSQIP